MNNMNNSIIPVTDSDRLLVTDYGNKFDVMVQRKKMAKWVSLFSVEVSTKIEIKGIINMIKE